MKEGQAPAISHAPCLGVFNKLSCERAGSSPAHHFQSRAPSLPGWTLCFHKSEEKNLIFWKENKGEGFIHILGLTKTKGGGYRNASPTKLLGLKKKMFPLRESFQKPPLYSVSEGSASSILPTSADEGKGVDHIVG